MDTQNSLLGGQPVAVNTTTQVTDGGAPAYRPPVPALPTPPRRSKRRLVASLVVALILVIAGGAAYWQFGRKTTSTNNTKSTTQGAQQIVLTQAGSDAKPFAIAYSNVDPTTAQTCASQTVQAKLYTRPIAGGDRVATQGVSQLGFVEFSDIYKNEVALLASSDCESAGPSKVYFSQDAGKSYKKVYAAPNDTEIINSMKFASDGKTLLIAHYDSSPGVAATRKNILTEIDLAAGATKDIFTDKGLAIFVAAYDKQNGRLYHYRGCSQCDGNTFDTMVVRDIAKGTDTTLFKDTGKITADTNVKADLTKVLLTQGVAQTEALGDGPPYQLQEFDFASKATKLISIDSKTYLPAAGYTTDGDVYYAQGKDVYVISKDGKSTTAFEASKPIHAVYLVSPNEVVASYGDTTNGDFSLARFDRAAKSATNILNGDAKTNIFGVTWN